MAHQAKHETMASRARRPLRRRLPGAAVYLAFLLVVVEIALQAFYYVSVGQALWDRSTRPIYAPNEHTVYWNKPNLSVRHHTNEFRTMLYTNSQGLRSASTREEYRAGRDPSRYRIMLMGPSFAYGWGVNYEDSYGARLQDALNASGFAGDRTVQVINAGVPSLGPAGNLAWFRHVGQDFKPDLVIQFIYETMAVPRDVNWNDYDVDDAGYLIRKNRGRFYYAKEFAKQFAIVHYSWTLWARLSASFASNQRGAVIGSGRDDMRLRESFSPDQPEAGNAMAFYEQLRQAVADSGSQLLIVYVPTSYVVHPEDLSRWKHQGISSVRQIDAQREYDQAFCDFLRTQGYDCLNITPDLIDGAKQGTRLYYWLDIHWTPQGNLAAAQATARHLQDCQAASPAAPAPLAVPPAP